MSEPIGETFVTITPRIDEASFKASAETQIAAAVQNVKVDVAVAAGDAGGTNGQNSPLRRLQADAVAARAALEAAALAVNQTSAALLVGTGTEEAAVKAKEAFEAATLADAAANVKFALASGEAAAAVDLQTLALERNRRAQLENQQAGGGGSGLPGARSFDRQLRRVAEGEDPLSSLLAPASLLRFGAAGLAIGAVVTTLGEAEKALKVTGDEAFTTEGRFRNLGAALLQGNVIEGFKALNDQAPTLAENFEKMKKEASTSSVDLRNFGREADESATKLEGLAAAQDKVGGSGGAFGNAIKKAAEETRTAADDAVALANAYDAAAAAALGVAAAVARAGSEAAAFGEQTRGAGAVDAGNAARPRGSTGGTTDSTNTDATRNAEAEARARATDTLKDDLAQAKVEAAQAAQLEKNQQDVVEGRAARHRATVEANANVRKIQSDIDKQDAAARKKAADDAAREAKDAAAAVKKAQDEADRLFREGLANDRSRLELRLTDAEGTRTLADDRKALLALIRFDHERSTLRRLTVAERLSALSDEKNDRRALNDLNKQALSDALDVKKENLQTAINAAKLTDDTKDDDKANAAFLKFLKGRVAAAKGDAKALADARAELVAFQVSLKQTGKQGGGAKDLFQEAADEFATFGSNVTGQVGKGGILSGQDARGALGGLVLGGKSGGALLDAQLTEAQKQTALLQQIANSIGTVGTRTPEPRGHPPPAGARKAQSAAAFLGPR